MIRRLRLRAGLFLSLGLLFAGWTLTAYATQPVTRSEMESFVYGTLAVAGSAILLGGAGLIAWVLHRDRTLQKENLDLRFEALHVKLDDFAEDCARHRCGLGPRSPLDSPNAKREDDSGEHDRNGIPWVIRRGRRTGEETPE